MKRRVHPGCITPVAWPIPSRRTLEEQNKQRVEPSCITPVAWPIPPRRTLGNTINKGLTRLHYSCHLAHTLAKNLRKQIEKKGFLAHTLAKNLRGEMKRRVQPGCITPVAWPISSRSLRGEHEKKGGTRLRSRRGLC